VVSVTRKQCKHCPWRVDVDPHEIPNGYCERKHAALSSTIATPGALELGKALRVMACHESKPRRELACVGWLANQLGRGNNIALRIAAIRDRKLTDFTLVGEQHETLEDTLPKRRT
jgi:hypothetical protein